VTLTRIVVLPSEKKSSSSSWVSSACGGPFVVVVVVVVVQHTAIEPHILLAYTDDGSDPHPNTPGRGRGTLWVGTVSSDDAPVAVPVCNIREGSFVETVPAMSGVPTI
jgi:hypothetical protein